MLAVGKMCATRQLNQKSYVSRCLDAVMGSASGMRLSRSRNSAGWLGKMLILEERPAAILATRYQRAFQYVRIVAGLQDHIRTEVSGTADGGTTGSY